MTTNRDHTQHEARQRAKDQELDRRRAVMHAAEGHSGSIPRGNQQPEAEHIGSRRYEYERVLGH